MKKSIFNFTIIILAISILLVVLWNNINSRTRSKAEVEKVAGMDLTKVDLVADENGVEIPVPKGYVLSDASDEKDVNKGAVIYEGTKKVVDTVSDANTEDDVLTAKTTRNQFVWVPVSAENVSRIYREDENGRKFGRLYDYDSEKRTEMSNIGSYTEPRILTNYDNEKYFKQYNLYGYTRDKLYEEMQKNYEESIESIERYGGFYIGRYETGDLKQKVPVVKQYNTDIYGQPWYTMYNKAQNVGANKNVKTMIIYGSMWDEVLMWLIESGAKDYAGVGGDSTSWGNYTNVAFEYYETAEAISTTTKVSPSATRIPTGAKAGSEENNWKRNCVNNIYDLAGNVEDWTQEGCNATGRVRRGGHYYPNGSNGPADSRFGDVPTYIDNAIGCRLHFNIL